MLSFPPFAISYRPQPDSRLIAEGHRAVSAVNRGSIPHPRPYPSLAALPNINPLTTQPEGDLPEAGRHSTTVGYPSIAASSTPANKN